MSSSSLVVYGFHLKTNVSLKGKEITLRSGERAGRKLSPLKEMKHPRKSLDRFALQHGHTTVFG